MSEVVAVVVAAGTGRRFGGGKLLARMANGVRIIDAVLKNIRQGFSGPVVVVARDDDRQLLEVLQGYEPGLVAGSADQTASLGGTIATGVAASADAAAWLVVLGDMPWLLPSTIATLEQKLQDGCPLVAPVYGGRRGHPVGFGREFGAALQGLGGQEGARTILGQYRNQLQLVDLGDPGVLQDVDYPDDLARSSVPV